MTLFAYAAPLYCDVALPVVLEAQFTYRIAEAQPVVGGRVIVPFGRKADAKLSGVVTRIHSDEPKPGVRMKSVLQVVDTEPVLDEKLLELGRWISQYYLAPLGETYAAMLPLQAEFRKLFGWRITALGADALETPTQLTVAAVEALAYMAERETVREASLREACEISREELRDLLKRKLVERVDLSGARDAVRKVRVIARGEGELGSLTKKQQPILDALDEVGGRMQISVFKDRALSPGALQTLVARGALRIEEVEAAPEPHRPALKPRLLNFALTAAQQSACEQILEAARARRFEAMLLHGVTGSGKTAVYLSAMRALLDEGRGSLLLVPEIGLTPGMVSDLHAVFGEQIAVLHSSLGGRERAEQWRRLRSGAARIVVGTRSAIFAPVQNLSLIIVDEEHDGSYKQEETPRYHARDVAAVRARLESAVALFGSATPSLESYANAVLHNKYRYLPLTERPSGRPLPTVEVVDMRAEYKQTGKQQMLSTRLSDELKAGLERGEQAMVLLNRRGYSSFVMCRECGVMVECHDCAVAMTYHKARHRLLCHYCGASQPAPKTCPHCHSEYVQYLGSGSEKLEETLAALLPSARIGRMDRDTVRGHDSFEQMLSSFQAGEIDLMAGTQMIAKGHDMPGVTLVGVLAADSALSMPDFRAAERTFQLLTQVAGRAGRGDTPGRVVLQTTFPEHYAVSLAAEQNYKAFADKELNFRRALGYPPFASVANVLVRSAELIECSRISVEVGRWFEANRVAGVRVMGPASAPITRLKKDHRQHFLLKSASRPKLNALLRAMLDWCASKRITRSNVVVDVDAQSLM